MDAQAAKHEYDIEPVDALEPGTYDAIIIAVGHHQVAEMGAAGLRGLGKPGAVLYDVKYVLPLDDVDGRL